MDGMGHITFYHIVTLETHPGYILQFVFAWLL